MHSTAMISSWLPVGCKPARVEKRAELANNARRQLRETCDRMELTCMGELSAHHEERMAAQ